MNTELTTNACTREMLDAVAQLHRESLPSGFLSSLGAGVLALVYRSLQQYPGGFVISAQCDGRVVGMASGADDVGRFYRWMLTRKAFSAGWRLLPKLLSPARARGVLETLRYAGKDRSADLRLPRAELISIAVAPDWRGLGVAEALYREVTREFERRGVDCFKIMVGHSLGRAQGFYAKMGAEKVGEIEVHQGRCSWIYLHRSKSPAEKSPA